MSVRGVYALDGVSLDEEITDILATELTDIFKDSSLPILLQRLHSRHSQDLRLLLKLTLFKLFIWDNSTTYGFILQNLKMGGLTNVKKVVILSNIIISYLLIKGDSIIHGSDSALMARVRTWIPYLINIRSIFDLFTTLNFLVNRQQLSMLHLLLNIRYQPLNSMHTSFISNPESISYEFQNRQLIWNGLTEFLKVVPSIPIPPKIKSIWNNQSKLIPKYNNLPLRCCAICYNNDLRVDNSRVFDDNLVYNPWITSCGHIYCYICLLNELKRCEQSWNCLRCHVKVETISIFKQGMELEADPEYMRYASEKTLEPSSSLSSSDGESSDSEISDSESLHSIADSESESSFYEYDDV